MSVILLTLEVVGLLGGPPLLIKECQSLSFKEGQNDFILDTIF